MDTRYFASQTHSWDAARSDQGDASDTRVAAWAIIRMLAAIALSIAVLELASPAPAASNTVTLKPSLNQETRT